MLDTLLNISEENEENGEEIDKIQIEHLLVCLSLLFSVLLKHVIDIKLFNHF